MSISITSPTRLVDKLDALHASYVVAIDNAVSSNDLATVHALAADYDREALVLTARHEGREHLLPMFGLDESGEPLPLGRTTAVRRLIERFTSRQAA